MTEGFFKALTIFQHLCLEKFKSEVPVGPPKQKALLFGVLFVLSIELGTLTPLRACTNGVRISDESRCLLASKRLGRNSSYSEPNQLVHQTKKVGFMPTFFVCLYVDIQGLEPSVKKNIRGMFFSGD